MQLLVQRARLVLVENMLASTFGRTRLEVVDLAEALAIREDVSNAKSAGHWPVAVESDSLSVDKLLKNEKFPEF